MTSSIRKRFVSVNGRLVHYRTAGSGPPVVVFHDSPRSSAMHGPLLGRLSKHFTVFALDTPGNGNSDPLPGEIAIPDLSTAMEQTLDALGIRKAGFYGFHTSSKILLDFVVRAPDRVSVAILDGLSLPDGGPDPVYIAKYMRPFEIDDDGAYIAREWTRMRDSNRWFPWFSREPAHRTQSASPDPERGHQQVLDYFSAAASYRSVYTAAMMYWAPPTVMKVTVPMTIMARADDVLSIYLDKLPQPLPPTIAVEKLGSDADAWLGRVESIMLAHALDAPPFDAAALADGASGYIDLPKGQIRVRRFGDGPGRPVLYLHETPGGAGGAEDLLETLAQGRTVLAPDLPGCGLSDPLPSPTADGYVEALAAIVDAMDGPVDLVAQYTSTPLAVQLMAKVGDKIHRAVLDGVMLADASERDDLKRNYCPPLPYEFSGSFLHRAWHMLRDQQIQWPWYDGRPLAARKVAVQLDGDRLHRRMLDVMNGKDRYGDAVMAALEHDARLYFAAVRSPTLVTRADDPRHQWAGEAAALSEQVQAADLPGDLAGRVALFHSFLDGA